jgi:hypothetical protein
LLLSRLSANITRKTREREGGRGEGVNLTEENSNWILILTYH